MIGRGVFLGFLRSWRAWVGFLGDQLPPQFCDGFRLILVGRDRGFDGGKSWVSFWWFPYRNLVMSACVSWVSWDLGLLCVFFFDGIKNLFLFVHLAGRTVLIPRSSDGRPADVVVMPKLLVQMLILLFGKCFF